MTIDQIDDDKNKEKRIKERRADNNRRTSVRFGDVLGRRNGTDRRDSMRVKSGR